MGEGMTDRQAANWGLVVKYLHYSAKTRLPHHVEDAVWELADGFGPCSIRYIRESLQYDWSHIRDSSTEAVAEMAGYLRGAGYR